MPDIELEKPLKLKRASVISKLKENFEKEKNEREEAEQKERDARAEFETFVKEHTDQVVNYLRSRSVGAGVSWKGTLESFEETFENDSFATKESKPGRLETELEKLTRVLEMSSEETIEVKPTQRVYDLL
jgi:hypothetical protein